MCIRDRSYGLCGSDDRPCDRSWSVNEQGYVTSIVLPNRSVKDWDKKPKESCYAVASGKHAPLKALVADADFDRSLDEGFACQGPRDDADAVWELSFDDGRGVRTRHVEHCISGDGAKQNLPRALLAILRKDRILSSKRDIAHRPIGPMSDCLLYTSRCV